jgi:hypothetical protein
LVVAFGVNRYSSFDRAAFLNVIDESAGFEVEDFSREFETGSIYLYSAGAGIEISPKVAMGLSLNVYSGDDTFVWDYAYRDETNNISETINRQIVEDYIGASLKGGILARPNAHLSIGLAVETPLDYQVEYFFEEDYTYNDSGTGEYIAFFDAFSLEYDLTRPFIIGAGVAVRSGTFTLTGDAEYADWSQLSYNDNHAMSIDNDILSSLYRDVVNLRAGAEYQVPRWGLSFRGGIFTNPLAYRKAYIDEDRLGYSLGFGWLVDRVLLLETALVNGNFERRYTANNSRSAFAEDSFKRIFVNLSYRY